MSEIKVSRFICRAFNVKLNIGNFTSLRGLQAAEKGINIKMNRLIINKTIADEKIRKEGLE